MRARDKNSFAQLRSIFGSSNLGLDSRGWLPWWWAGREVGVSNKYSTFWVQNILVEVQQWPYRPKTWLADWIYDSQFICCANLAKKGLASQKMLLLPRKIKDTCPMQGLNLRSQAYVVLDHPYRWYETCALTNWANGAMTWGDNLLLPAVGVSLT